MWNCWHGCTKLSAGCLNCYMYRRDAMYGKDSTVAAKTGAFRLPVKKDRQGRYKIPSGELVYTCFTSDFFLEEADEWRKEAWEMIRFRPDLTFFIITKRPDRFYAGLPKDWGDGYDNVCISCTCESQYTADLRLPVFLELPIKHKSITHEPMLQKINIRKYLREYGSVIESVSCGGESGPDARPCDYAWVLDTMLQCVEYDVSFFFHQTGANFIRAGKQYHIERKDQHLQAAKAGIDYTRAG
jgi:protein gp37